jgi:hypothetical protein
LAASSSAFINAKGELEAAPSLSLCCSMFRWHATKTIAANYIDSENLEAIAA